MNFKYNLFQYVVVQQMQDVVEPTYEICGYVNETDKVVLATTTSYISACRLSHWWEQQETQENIRSK